MSTKVRGKDLIESRIQIDQSGCWLWQGPLDKHGYARLGGAVIGHRYAYRAFVGPIPEGLEIDHLCHTASSACPSGANCPHRRCVNPQHLEPVTRAENNRRRWIVAKKTGIGRKTACVHGHEYTAANTDIRSNGTRACRICAGRRAERARCRAGELVLASAPLASGAESAAVPPSG